MSEIKQCRVLVIDDDAAIRKAFQFALEDSVVEVDTADSGENGVARIRDQNANTPYDLIFLDMKMPGMNGAETLRELRNFDTGIPVYIVTAFHKEFLLELQSLRKEGIRFDLLRKPLGIDEINMLVDSVTRKDPQQYY